MKKLQPHSNVDPILESWFSGEDPYHEIDSCLLTFYKISELLMQVNSAQEKAARSILADSFSRSFSVLYDILKTRMRALPYNAKNRLLDSLQEFADEFVKIIEEDFLYKAREELSVFLNAVFYLKKPGSEHIFFYKAYNYQSKFNSINSSQFLLESSLTRNGFSSIFAACLSGCEDFLVELNMGPARTITYDFLTEEVSKIGLDLNFFPPSWLDYSVDSVLETFCRTDGIPDTTPFAECYKTLAKDWSGNLGDLLKTSAAFATS